MLSGQFLAILSAVLFGVSPVFCKLLIGEMSPALLAGLLYLGSGIRPLNGISSSFICPYLYNFINGRHEYFPVTGIAGMGTFLDYVDNLINHGIIHNDFQLYA